MTIQQHQQNHANSSAAPTAGKCLHCGDTYANPAGRCGRCNGPLLAIDDTRPRPGSPEEWKRLSDVEPEAEDGTPLLAKPAPAPAPAPTPEAKKVKLLKTRKSLAWLASTDTLIADYQEQLDTLDDRIKRIRDEAEVRIAGLTSSREPLRIAIQALRGLAGQVEIADPSAAAATPDQSPSSPSWSGKSSVQVSACIDCNRSDAPHIANGRCRTCDGRWRQAGQPRTAHPTLRPPRS